MKAPKRVICQVLGCKRKAVAKGYCSTHYQRVAKTGSLGGPIKGYGKFNPHVWWKSFLFIALAGAARAGLPVIDYSHIAVSTGNEVVNFVKWAKTEVSAAQTQLNTLQSYENSIVQLARMGDPGALRNLPGISTVAELYGTGQQLLDTYGQWKGYFNPQRYQSDFNSILGSYQLGSWQGYMGSSYGGYNIAPLQGAYQWDTARWNVTNSAEAALKKLEDQRERLQQQRDTALQSIQSATDQSQIQKYTGELNGLNGAIAEVAAHEANVLGQVRLKEAQIQSGQNVYQRRSIEQGQAQDWQTLESMELGQLPVGGWQQPMMWRTR